MSKPIVFSLKSDRWQHKKVSLAILNHKNDALLENPKRGNENEKKHFIVRPPKDDE